MLDPTKNQKPLGIKCYGSIGHLPGSRRGPGDHGVNDGQYRICCERVRDMHDTIIVQEKLDGSNVGAAKIGGEIVALNRAGYEASTSPYRQHRMWAAWVRLNAARFSSLLNEGERVVGEWLAQAHGTRYDLHHEPFVAFDLMVGGTRACYSDVKDRLSKHGFISPFSVVSVGDPVSIDAAMDHIGEYGHHGAVEPAEGAVWRVERKGKVDFLAKYVRPGKIDGKYLPGAGGAVEVWNVTLEGNTDA